MNILCVDDEQLLLWELESTVKAVAEDGDVHSFTRASEALEWAEQNRIDIAFLDINMRNIDGVTMAKRLQQMYPQVNIVFCTGYSEYALDALDINCSGYIMKPVTTEKIKHAIDTLRYPPSEEKKGPRLRITCFGNFDVTCDGVPVHFKYNKAKELLAYLVDRKGTMVSRNEAEAILFEDGDHSEYMTKLRRDLIDTFAALGVFNLLNVQKALFGVNREAAECDFFDYLDGKPGVKFQGEYLTQYSWAEETAATLWEEKERL